MKFIEIEYNLEGASIEIRQAEANKASGITSAKVQILPGDYPVIKVRNFGVPLTTDLQKLVDTVAEKYDLDTLHLTLINHLPDGIPITNMTQYNWAIYNNMIYGRVSSGQIQGVGDDLIQALLERGRER